MFIERDIRQREKGGLHKVGEAAWKPEEGDDGSFGDTSYHLLPIASALCKVPKSSYPSEGVTKPMGLRNTLRPGFIQALDKDRGFA